MSPLLSFAIVLLLVVAGLALWQRWRRDQPTERGASSPAAGPRDVPAPDSASTPRRIQDSVLGNITYVGHGFWTRDDLEFGGVTVQLEICGAEAGPTEEIRQYLEAALSTEGNLDARARAAIHADARERAMVIPDAGPVVYANQVSIGIDGDRVFRGYVWYTSDDPDGEFGVSSTDTWRTLTVEFIG